MMTPSVIFVLHVAKEGERISAQTAPLMPPVVWDMGVLNEIAEMRLYDSARIDERGDLVIEYTDTEILDQATDEEIDQTNELIAKAAGVDISDALFEPCICMIVTTMPIFAIDVSFVEPSSTEFRHN